MKPSVFNAIFENDGEHVVFNTLSGALVALDEAGLAALNGACGARGDAADARNAELADALDAELAGADTQADAATEQLRAQLAEAGLLVPDDLNERAWFYRHHLDDMAQTDFLSLCLAPTMACNLRCLYCYESHDPIRMSDEVAGGVMRFIQRRWEKYQFSDLSITWYGGEPTLEMDRIESLSARMQAWCAEHEVQYRSGMVTNASLITDEMAARLMKAGVTEAMPTLDGLATRHDARRVAANGGGSFEETMRGIRAMQQAGIHVGVNCNLDWMNEDDFRQLRQEFAGEPGVEVFASHLRNYGGWYGSNCAQPGANGMISECHASRTRGSSMDAVRFADAGEGAGEAAAQVAKLMTRREYSEQLFELYDELNPGMGGLYESLRSKRHFCQGKSASYFVIEPEGNVCRCDGQMCNPEYVLFNVLDEEYGLDWPTEHGFMDPASVLRDSFAPEANCATCVVAPLCIGECEWERRMFEDNCMALKYTLDRYVLKLRGFFPQLDEGEHVFAILPPRDVEELYATPFRPWMQGVMG